MNTSPEQLTAQAPANTPFVQARLAKGISPGAINRDLALERYAVLNRIAAARYPKEFGRACSAPEIGTLIAAAEKVFELGSRNLDRAGARGSRASH